MGALGNATGHGGIVPNKHPTNSAINKSGKGQHLDNNSSSTASKTFSSNYGQNSESTNGGGNSHSGNNNSSSLTISDLSSR